MSSIPGFSKYKISRAGELRAIVGNGKVPTHRSNGYIFVHIVDDDGNRLSVGIHRLLALAFIPFPDVAEALVINHKDGVKDNNRLDNLEWVTRSENQNHSVLNGMSNIAIPVIVTDLETNEIFCFPSKVAFFSEFGVPRTLRQTFDKKVMYFLKFKIEFLLDCLNPARLTLYPNGLLVRNIFTKTVYICDRLADVEKITGIERKVVKRILRGKRFLYPTNGFDIRAEIDPKWPEYSEEELQAFKGVFFIHNPVLVIDSEGNKSLFGSVLKASEYTKTYERTIRECIKTKTKCAHGFLYIKHNRKPIPNY